MYIPSSFAVTDRSALLQFLEQHSFATLVSVGADGPEATHLPLLVERQGEAFSLVGHLARANPQWQRADGTKVLAVFHGPHAYISPTWYETNETVPTWNYAAVHVTGVLQLINDEARLRSLVERTVETYEQSMPQPWSMSVVPGGTVTTLLKGIVGFEISVERIEGKWKLNQNHPRERREKVIRGLEARGRAGDADVARLMRELVEAEGE